MIVAYLHVGNEYGKWQQIRPDSRDASLLTRQEGSSRPHKGVVNERILRRRIFVEESMNELRGEAMGIDKPVMDGLSAGVLRRYIFLVFRMVLKPLVGQGWQGHCILPGKHQNTNPNDITHVQNCHPESSLLGCASYIVNIRGHIGQLWKTALRTSLYAPTLGHTESRGQLMQAGFVGWHHCLPISHAGRSSSPG